MVETFTPCSAVVVHNRYDIIVTGFYFTNFWVDITCEIIRVGAAAQIRIFVTLCSAIPVHSVSRLRSSDTTPPVIAACQIQNVHPIDPAIHSSSSSFGRRRYSRTFDEILYQRLSASNHSCRYVSQPPAKAAAYPGQAGLAKPADQLPDGEGRPDIEHFFFQQS